MAGKEEVGWLGVTIVIVVKCWQNPYTYTWNFTETASAWKQSHCGHG